MSLNQTVLLTVFMSFFWTFYTHTHVLRCFPNSPPTYLYSSPPTNIPLDKSCSFSAFPNARQCQSQATQFLKSSYEVGPRRKEFSEGVRPASMSFFPTPCKDQQGLTCCMKEDSPARWWMNVIMDDKKPKYNKTCRNSRKLSSTRKPK